MEDFKFNYTIESQVPEDTLGGESGGFVTTKFMQFERKEAAFHLWIILATVQGANYVLDEGDRLTSGFLSIDKWEGFSEDIQVTYTYLGDDGWTDTEESPEVLVAKVAGHYGVDYGSLELKVGDTGSVKDMRGTLRLEGLGDRPQDVVWQMSLSDGFAREYDRMVKTIPAKKK